MAGATLSGCLFISEDIYLNVGSRQRFGVVSFVFQVGVFVRVSQWIRIDLWKCNGVLTYPARFVQCKVLFS